MAGQYGAYQPLLDCPTPETPVPVTGICGFHGHGPPPTSLGSPWSTYMDDDALLPYIKAEGYGWVSALGVP